jgi:hypothetical protein
MLLLMLFPVFYLVFAVTVVALVAGGWLFVIDRMIFYGRFNVAMIFWGGLTESYVTNAKTLLYSKKANAQN